jgi:hypothetical protein
VIARLLGSKSSTWGANVCGGVPPPDCLASDAGALSSGALVDHDAALMSLPTSVSISEFRSFAALIVAAHHASLSISGNFIVVFPNTREESILGSFPSQHD